MEFHGTCGAPISLTWAVPWNSVEFHGTWSALISLTRAVPWNSMELGMRQYRWQEQFHGIPLNLECANFADTRSSMSYHGYAMRKILPLCRKTVTCKSKGFLCLFSHNNRIHCFCLKNLNLFSQNITFRVINYLNLVEKIIRNWNVDEVSVPIISKDIR